MKKLKKLPLLARVIIAIALGVGLGQVLPLPVVRVFVTFNSIFGNFLQFLVPLIIIGLITPAISDIGKAAGKLLLITTILAYGDTVFSGFLSYFTSSTIFPSLISHGEGLEQVSEIKGLEPFFTINIPPLVDVMSALVTAFTVGLGIAFLDAKTLKAGFDEFKEIVTKTIEVALIPLLPVYIFGIFLEMTHTGQAWRVLNVFISIIGVLFALHIFLLVLQYCIAGAIVHRNPFRLLWNMMPAYFTALGTSSSAATIPVTLKSTLKNDVGKGIAGFVVPLCATIHLSGSCLKIVACCIALMLMTGMPVEAPVFVGFIFMLGVVMVAAPGVPGGAIMAALGVIQSFFGFDAQMQALMIAIYISIDSFGTACNVTGDGAIALIVDKINSRREAKT